MADELKLNHPWLVAVWPGMGHVAMTSGYYLLSKLGMNYLAEFSANSLFEFEHVEVRGGLIRMGQLPRSRFFVWIDPKSQRDIVVFIGEAQPHSGKYAFCRHLVEYAKSLGIERVFTFAAMATQMHPTDDSRVFGAATDLESLAELKRLDLQLLENGQIGGLNGVLLGVAAQARMHGCCLLGEMPHIFAQLPNPKAALSVLKIFTMLADLEIDFTELREQAHAVDDELSRLVTKIEDSMDDEASDEDEESADQGNEPAADSPSESPDEPGLSPADQRRIEELFAQARDDRSKAYELKRELDRLNVFADYENRFLDLFKKPDAK